MPIGIALVAIGLIVALFLNTTIGIIVVIAGVLFIVAAFAGWAPGGPRRDEVVIERERPVTRERVVEREAPAHERVVERDPDAR